MTYATQQTKLEAMRAYARTEEGKAARLRANTAYRKRYRDRRAARDAVAREIARGTILVCACEVCGHDEAEAHHPDYSRPLFVIWLCDEHHKLAHREMRAAASATETLAHN